MSFTEYERTALIGLMEKFKSLGREITNIEWPDKSPNSNHRDLTVDLACSIDGQPYAVDHTRASHAPNRVSDIRHARNLVYNRLDKIAKTRGVQLDVWWYPPSADSSNKNIQQYCDDIVALAEKAALHPGTRFNKDATSTVLASKTNTPDVNISEWSADDPLMRNQVTNGIRTSVQKKLDSQLKRAHENGYLTILLLDEIAPDNSKQRSLSDVLPGTYRQALESMIKESGVLNELWVRLISGRYHQVWPAQ